MRSRHQARKRAKQHQHALERLRERYMPEAEMVDVIEVRDRAQVAFRAWLARGKAPGSPWVIERPFCDAVETTIEWKGRSVRVVYVPALNALRTILPLESFRAEGARHG